MFMKMWKFLKELMNLKGFVRHNSSIMVDEGIMFNRRINSSIDSPDEVDEEFIKELSELSVFFSDNEEAKIDFILKKQALEKQQKSA